MLARKPLGKRTRGPPRSRWKEHVNLSLCEINYVNGCGQGLCPWSDLMLKWQEVGLFSGRPTRGTKIHCLRLGSEPVKCESDKLPLCHPCCVTLRFKETAVRHSSGSELICSHHGNKFLAHSGRSCKKKCLLDQPCLSIVCRVKPFGKNRTDFHEILYWRVLLKFADTSNLVKFGQQ